MNTTFERNTDSGKTEWLTPPEILTHLGEFDVDPCAPVNRPCDIAKQRYTIHDNGLQQQWHGRVFCNPPYGRETEIWLQKCAEHGNAIALTFARTETNMFFNTVWNKANAVFFIKSRLKFYHVNGKQGGAAGAPSVLIAYGIVNAIKLHYLEEHIQGKFISLR